MVIDHGVGLQSLFAHLSRTDVREGDHVARGQVLGAVGATGRATGPHLHWTVRLNGARVDPLSLIYALGVERQLQLPPVFRIGTTPPDWGQSPVRFRYRTGEEARSRGL